jgi:hypothetical protein
MIELKEVAYSHADGEAKGTLCATQRKWITKMKKFAAKYPKQVVVKRINSDGSMIIEIPISWFKISPRKEMSEKHKKEAVDRLSKARENKA